MTSSKNQNAPKVDEQGNLVVDLPFSRQQVTLKRPKARDMEAIELAAKGTTSNTGVLIATLSTLSGLSIDEVADLDAEDTEVLGEALKGFPVFRKLLG